MTQHALHSSKDQNWQTPPRILDLVRGIAPIAFDPCSAPDNPTGALGFCSPEAPEPAHLSAWAGPCGLRAVYPTGEALTFANTPYGAHLSGPVDPERKVYRTIDGVRVHVGTGTGWCARLAAHEGHWINLCPNRTDSAWFETLHRAADLRIELYDRVAFVNASTGLVGPSPNHGSVMFYRAPLCMWSLDWIARVRYTFRKAGRVLPGGMLGRY